MSSLVPVSDASEEIFDLYSTRAASGSRVKGGLGFISTVESTLTLTVTVDLPPSHSAVHDQHAKRPLKRTTKARVKEPVSKTIERQVIVSQDLAALRHRSGDTGSVVWRSSLSFAHLLLAAFFGNTTSSLLPDSFDAAQADVLELGSGTGFLGIACRPFVRSWTFTDLYENLALIVKNVRKNDLDPSNESIIEIDWLDPAPVARRKPSSNDLQDSSKYPDLIVACDCVYNEHLSVPLALSIDRLAGPATTVLIAGELRDPDPLEAFLSAWLELGWKISRFTNDEVVVWVGTKAGQ